MTSTETQFEGKPKGLYILAGHIFAEIYGPDEQADIATLADIFAPPQTRDSVAANPEILADVEVILSGWGAPVIDAAFLKAAPNLKALFYGAGATSGLISREAWDRGIVVSGAFIANAIPVAEFSLAAIIFGLKRVLPLTRAIQTTGTWGNSTGKLPGGYRSTVGLVSLGAVGLLTLERLLPALPDVRVLVHDPFFSEDEAASRGLNRVDLETIFSESDVVSLHTPWLPETVGLIRGEHLRTMKPGATLINTARGAVINEGEMIAVLQERPDLTAMLDVTYPEPPPPGSPLYTLPNVFLTPHIAGSTDLERTRMGRYMVDELRRYCHGEPFLWQIRPEASYHTVHRTV